MIKIHYGRRCQETSGTPVNIGNATAIDACLQSLTNNAPDLFQIGNTTITWIAVDSSGNTSSDNQIVTISDTTSPVITPPADIIVECTGVGGQSIDIGMATAYDTCCADVSITNNAPSLYSVGETIVTWTATDCNGNIVTATQKVTVVDTTSPELSVPSNVTVECPGPEGTAVDIGAATASDVCCSELQPSNDAPDVFPVGTTIVTWTVTDCNGNTKTAKQSVSVQDKSAPALAAPADITVEATGPNGQSVNLGSATASDICCDIVNITNDSPELFYVGTAIVTWRAEDCNGNITTATQKVTVTDTTPPVITVTLSPSVLWPPNHKMVLITPTINTSDIACSNVDVALISIQINEGDIENTYDPEYDIDPSTGFMGNDVKIIDGKIYLRSERAGTSLKGRIYTITYRATDCNGVSSVASAIVTVPHDMG